MKTHKNRQFGRFANENEHQGTPEPSPKKRQLFLYSLIELQNIRMTNQTNGKRTGSYAMPRYNLSRDIRKPDLCICENKAADQLLR